MFSVFLLVKAHFIPPVGVRYALDIYDIKITIILSTDYPEARGKYVSEANSMWVGILQVLRKMRKADCFILSKSLPLYTFGMDFF